MVRQRTSGWAAIAAVIRARGMEISGALDSILIGEDAGKISGMVEPLEVPILNNLTMVLGSISQATGVVVDFTEPSTVFDNVKQGCLVAPTLSVGSVLLQQAAISASFHYSNVEIVEPRPTPSDLPSPEAKQIAINLTDLGQLYNREDVSTDNAVLGDDGIRVHSSVLPGLPSSTNVHFSGAGEVYKLRHDITNVQSLIPRLIC